jgi:SAM-dependent methyltransferase
MRRAATSEKRALTKLGYAARNFMSPRLFAALRQHCRGHVLDIGGWDFYRTAIRERVPFERWTVLESDPGALGGGDDPRITWVRGDGCRMSFADGQFDTVLGIQVAEHVFEPIELLREAVRVLRPGGYGVFLVPQTGNLHMAPHHYQNFTRFWILEATRRAGVELIELTSLGGGWRTAASRLLYAGLQIVGVREVTYPGVKRNAWFYLLRPLMLLYIAVNIPLCLLLSLGDFEEEANNHLFVFRKPPGDARSEPPPSASAPDVGRTSEALPRAARPA